MKMLEEIRSVWASFRLIVQLLRAGGPYQGLIPACHADTQLNIFHPTEVCSSLLNGWYLATPKKRRSTEVRRARRMMSFVMDRYRPREDLVPCAVCGNFNQRGFLCVNCYEKAREETNALRALVGDKLPSDTEIRFVYKNDSAEVQPEKAKAIRVDRERPAWFPGNLLQRSRDPTPSE
ncbi:54S ribosomal protein L32, mitochondrial [Clonorchis sinensis]|uniref:54S ribosomal protein L32, mitochondrial n=1 Tax=Clonorchis sinensis TaxID=79923 RepID=A0A8T1M712_CLOSI|nr:54S ribosomal protein L32, mitochondrial [Clonorchis sinensis]